MSICCSLNRIKLYYRHNTTVHCHHILIAADVPIIVAYKHGIRKIWISSRKLGTLITVLISQVLSPAYNASFISALKIPTQLLNTLRVRRLKILY